MILLSTLICNVGNLYVLASALIPDQLWWSWRSCSFDLSLIWLFFGHFFHYFNSVGLAPGMVSGLWNTCCSNPKKVPKVLLSQCCGAKISRFCPPGLLDFFYVNVYVYNWKFVAHLTDAYVRLFCDFILISNIKSDFTSISKPQFRFQDDFLFYVLNFYRENCG